LGRRGGFVVYVGGIKKRDEDVNVQESDHEPLLLIQQAIDQFHAHWALARTLREQRDSVADGGLNV
jgi:hypothetical protein